MTRNPVLLTVLAGLVFGVLASVANVLGLPVLSKVLGDGWSWAALGVVVAAISQRRPTLMVIVVLVSAVTGYYASDLILGVYDWVDFSDPLAQTDPAHADRIVLWSFVLQDFVVWSAIALLVSWPLARVGVATRRTDAWGLVARLVVPLIAVVEVLALRLPGELAVQSTLITVATYALVVVAGVAAVATLCVRHFRRTRRPAAAVTT